MTNENDLIFEEHPLLYIEAVRLMRKFERAYSVSSEELFSALQRGEGKVEVDPDDLFEWRTYFHFKKEVEARLERFLKNRRELEDVVYASTGCVEAPQRTSRDRRQSAALVAA
jgi:hypothetical protein